MGKPQRDLERLEMLWPGRGGLRSLTEGGKYRMGTA